MLGIVWNDLICRPFIGKESTFMSYMKQGKYFPSSRSPSSPDVCRTSWRTSILSMKWAIHLCNYWLLITNRPPLLIIPLNLEYLQASLCNQVPPVCQNSVMLANWQTSLNTRQNGIEIQWNCAVNIINHIHHCNHVNVQYTCLCLNTTAVRSTLLRSGNNRTRVGMLLFLERVFLTAVAEESSPPQSSQIDALNQY